MLNEYLLLGLVQYGIPVLFGVILAASIGLPLPASLLLLAAGSFVAQGDLQMLPVVGLTSCAAVLGDQLGYGVGRWGSQRLILRISRWSGGADRVEQAAQATRRWGSAGIFLTRWLMTPLGPVINLTSGVTRYPWPAFVCFDIAGEVLWVTLYVTLGRLFSDQVQTLSSMLGDFTWVIVGAVTIVVLVRLLIRQYRPAAVERSNGLDAKRVP
jgi:membrane protein DedA with SNARE-associated domain